MPTELNIKFSDTIAPDEQSASALGAQKQLWETPDLKILEPEETLAGPNQFIVEIINPPYHPPS